MLKKLIRGETLHKRLVSAILLITVSCLLLSCIVSYVALISVERNKTEAAMISNLEQITQNMDQLYLHMCQISEQMMPQGNIGNLVNTYLLEEKPYELYRGRNQIAKELVTIAFPSSNISLLCYFDQYNKRNIFESFTLKSDYGFDGLPGVVRVGDIVYNALHSSMRNYEKNMVISLMRECDFSKNPEILIYVEAKIDMTGYIETKSGKESSNIMPCILLQANEKGKICYSSNEEEFPLEENMMLEDILPKGVEKGTYGQYFVVAKTSDIGYTNLIMVRLSDYKKELYQWFERSAFVFLISIGMLYLMVWILSTIIYKPIRLFENEIKKLGEGSFDQIQYDTGVLEFNRLFEQFNEMKQQIKKLLTDVETKEKEKNQLELEKLIYQINPHFLMNTLNSVKWLAKLHNQPEISNFITDLNSILAYNLGKMDKITTFASEINMLRSYINLQQMRYDFKATIEVEEGEYLNWPTVRMLLQPLVENAIRYGLGDEGVINIRIFYHEERNLVVIMIEDRGKGLTKEKLIQLQEPFHYKQDGSSENAGIGLRYVRSMLESYYGDKAFMSINSEAGRGTKITLLLPAVQVDSFNQIVNSSDITGGLVE
ncbi:MAG: histidine kinase [Clostridiaceae bacterium]|nr:histidine kinase [Clostridiaceae bacterium]